MFIDALYVVLCIFVGLCILGLFGVMIVLDAYFWDDVIDSDLNLLWMLLTLPFILIIDIIAIVILIIRAIYNKRNGW